MKNEFKKSVNIVKDPRLYLSIGIIISVLALLIIYVRIKDAQSENKSFSTLKIGMKIKFPQKKYDINNNIIDFNDIAILFFFDPNCGACIDELPYLNDLGSKLNNKTKIIAISRASKDKLNDFVKRMDLHMSFISDPEGEFFEKFHVYSIPFMIVINNSRIVTSPTQVNSNPLINLGEVENYIENSK